MPSKNRRHSQSPVFDVGFVYKPSKFACHLQMSPLDTVLHRLLGCGLDDELRGIGARLPAGKANSRAARGGERQVVRAIACNGGGHIHADPHARAKGSARSQRTAERRRVIVVER